MASFRATGSPVRTSTGDPCAMVAHCRLSSAHGSVRLGRIPHVASARRQPVEARPLAHTRGRVRAGNGPRTGGRESHQGACKPYGGTIGQRLESGTNATGPAAGCQYRRPCPDEHLMGGHGRRACRPKIRKIPVLCGARGPVRAGRVHGDIEQGRYPRRNPPGQGA